jgi:hypothetical protein
VANPRSISINTSTRIAYMYLAANTVTACDVTTGGLLTTCNTGMSISPASCTDSFGSVINPTTGYIYFICNSNDKIVGCQFNGKVVSNCQNNALSGSPNFAYLDVTANKMYVALFSSAAVAICNVNGVTVNGCVSATGVSLSNPEGIGGYTSGGSPYLFVGSNTNIQGCSVSGTTLTCSATGTGVTWTGAFATTVNADNTVAAVATGVSAVVTCNVAGATLTNCVSTSGFNEPYQAAFISG